jgi:hypothetical protein
VSGRVGSSGSCPGGCCGCGLGRQEAGIFLGLLALKVGNLRVVGRYGAGDVHLLLLVLRQQLADLLFLCGDLVLHALTVGQQCLYLGLLLFLLDLQRGDTVHMLLYLSLG